MSDRPTEPLPSESLTDRLEGWKAIAGHLNGDVRTAKRWEVSEGREVAQHRGRMERHWTRRRGRKSWRVQDAHTSSLGLGQRRSCTTAVCQQLEEVGRTLDEKRVLVSFLYRLSGTRFGLAAR
jgi:hypothetical protein